MNCPASQTSPRVTTFVEPSMLLLRCAAVEAPDFRDGGTEEKYQQLR